MLESVFTLATSYSISPMYVWMDGWLPVWKMGVCMDNVRLYGWMNSGRTDRQMEDGWMDGWMDGRMDGGMDGWTHG